jgi:hypothetical protein
MSNWVDGLSVAGSALPLGNSANYLRRGRLLAQAVLLVPGAGVEPAPPESDEILSLACLPISPPGLQDGKGASVAGKLKRLNEIPSRPIQYHSYLAKQLMLEKYDIIPNSS